MKTLALLLLMLGTACSTTSSDANHDYYGNLYPAECPANIAEDTALLAQVTIVRTHTSGSNGTTSLGGGLITINPRLSGWMLEDVTRHELCHAKRWLQGGDPDWHARHVPNVYRPSVCANPFHC